jgi:vacuolar-type H+-ATPase subunit H
MSYQDRPTPSEPAPDDPGDRLERPRPEQGAGQEDASAGDRARGTASTGKEKAREVASTTSQQARKVASTTQNEAHEVVRGVNEQARRLAGDTRQELLSQANSQVDRLAQGLNDVSRQLRSMSENGEPGAVSDMAREAAVRTQKISERLRGGGIDGVLGQLRSAGRNRPGLFLFGAFGVGLVAGRVVRNLAQEPSDNGSSDIGPSGGGAPSRSVETGYEGSPETGASHATPRAPDHEALPAAPASNEARGG